MSKLKLITLNVEKDRHWDVILPFLEREAADVLCLQELLEDDLQMLVERFGYNYIQIPMTKKPRDNGHNKILICEGPAILTKLPFKEKHQAYYYKAADEIQKYRGATEAEKRETISSGIVWGTVEKDGKDFTIGCTHFTWTRDGMPNKNQEEDADALLEILSKIPKLLLCGDFNIPRRHNYLYKKFAEKFKDNVPADIETTLDLNKHVAGKNPVERPRVAQFVVDYIFSTPEYKVSKVRCEYGLSDHAALIAEVS